MMQPHTPSSSTLRKLDQGVVELGLAHKDGQAHQVVVRDGEVHHVLALCHHRDWAHGYVRSLHAAPTNAEAKSAINS